MFQKNILGDTGYRRVVSEYYKIKHAARHIVLLLFNHMYSYIYQEYRDDCVYDHAFF